jgi:hypothetical protein
MIIFRYTLIFALGLIHLSVFAQNSIERIPLESIRLPSNDLYLPGYGVLSPEEAFERQLNTFNPLDLSRLNPLESELWSNNISEQRDSLDLQSRDEVFFRGVLTSQSGTFRFNVDAINNLDHGPYIVVLDKSLHTLLLRKNLLRKMGYKIPAIKYVPELILDFEDLEQKNRFLNQDLPRATFGAPRRWIREGLDDDNLSITLQDVAVTRPSEFDHFNLAFGVPPRSLASRTLRSLIIPYALLDIEESINKVEFSVGRVDNNHIVLPHFTIADMNATYEDALWAMRRLLSLSRRDLTEIVQMAYFPKEVELLLVEKLIARRNSLQTLFKLESEFPVLNFDAKISSGENLKDGMLKLEEWPGYASRFAHGLPDSPFKDFGYFLFAEGQSAVLNQLMSQANDRLRAFDLNEARFNYAREEFTRGLNHFVETGEFLEQQVGTWFSPTLDGQLILSRDIVIGNTMGTDNLVQLADTFGFSVRVGAHLGIEGLPQGISGSVSGGLSYLRTYTHLKPVKTLKESVKEPYRNMIVPFVKAMIQKRAQIFSDALNDDGELEQNELEEYLKNFNEYLGVGESLIITERLTPNALVSGRTSILNTQVSANIEGSGLTINRLHLYRKDSKTLQVYRDNGQSWSLAFTFAANQYVPILRFQNKKSRGEYDVRLHQLNLNLNLEENPDLSASMSALSGLLSKNDPELINDIAPATEVNNSFRENSNRLALFHWRSRNLRHNDLFLVRTPEGSENRLLRQTETDMSGLNYQAFATDLANYYISQYLPRVSFGSDTWVNPGQTTFGLAKTVQSRYEASLDAQNRMSREFLNISHRQEGWRISVNQLKRQLQEINDQFGRVLFPLETADTTSALKLYTITIDINLYERGVARLKALSNEELRFLGQVYRQRYGNTQSCRSSRSPHRNDLRRGGSALLRDEVRCGNFNPLIDHNNICKRRLQSGDNYAIALCLGQLAKKLEKHLDFNDFLELIGEQNFHVSGTLNGFRSNSEVLIDPVYSNTIGQVGSRFRQGPVEAVRAMIGMQNGEFSGSWMREQL